MNAKPTGVVHGKPTTRKLARAPFDHLARKRGPDGRPFCRWCGGSVPRPRRTFCSDGCVETFLIERNDPRTIRKLILKRDPFVCRICRLDFKAMQPRGAEMWRELQDRGFVPGMRLWQIDHIVPLWAGGSRALENLRLLCVPCHKTVTRQQARERADARKRATQQTHALDTEGNDQGEPDEPESQPNR